MFHIKIVILIFIFITFSESSFFFEKDIYPNHQDGDVIVYKEFQYTRKEILNQLYSDIKVPSGFYYENWNQSIQYIETENETNQVWHFYSTDNFTAAQIVVERFLQDNPHHPNNIVNFSETEKFFEFINEETWYSYAYNKNITWYLPYRIHKKSYIFLYNTIYFDWGTLLKLGMNISYNIGIFNLFPINQSNTKELCEYIWFINNYNLNLNSAFKSKMIEDNSSISYKLLECEGSGGDWGMYDIIQLIYSVYSINKSSGEFSLFKELFDEFNGRYNPGPFNTFNNDILPTILVLILVFFLGAIFIRNRYYKYR